MVDYQNNKGIYERISAINDKVELQVAFIEICARIAREGIQRDAVTNLLVADDVTFDRIKAEFDR